MDNATIVRALLDQVWSRGDTALIPILVAPAYTIHRDPGDRWAGQTLDHDTYAQRLLWCRSILEGLSFSLEDLLVDGDRVAVRWTYAGTQRGALPGLGVTGRHVQVTGMTLYPVVDGRVTGHWQETDQMGLMRQLGAPTGPR